VSRSSVYSDCCCVDRHSKATVWETGGDEWGGESEKGGCGPYYGCESLEEGHGGRLEDVDMEEREEKRRATKMRCDSRSQQL